MKNKVKLRKLLMIFICILFLLISLFLIINIYEYHMYNKNYNYKISSIVNIIEEKYSKISEKEILEILNSYDSKNEILEKYSIDLDDAILIKNNQVLFSKFIVLNMLFYILTIMFVLYYFLRFNKRKDKEIKKITKCIEEINKKNYKLDLDDISEDELSILKNEIYKTTINIKELAEISTKEKLELKRSLSDISHQLKTPLTSILIILDNLINNPDMEKDTREDFIKDIKREINSINFLVQSILKLSKFDTNTINFTLEDIKAEQLIKESIKNVSMLSDLKSVRVVPEYKNNPIIKGDFKWQVEALSNIIKNSIEHSFEKSVVSIMIEGNKVYSKISIINKGKRIDKVDLPHIFERFYRGKNATSDSIGIGLSLAKSIIEKDNGKIDVESDENVTKFIIKYFK